jgi:hypothetical protein
MEVAGARRTACFTMAGEEMEERSGWGRAEKAEEGGGEGERRWSAGTRGVERGGRLMR